MKADPPAPAALGSEALVAYYRQRSEELEAALDESRDTLEAIRRGEVDAVVVGDDQTEHRVYTLQSADRPYRVLIEQIQEGAVTLGADGTVLYCNRRLAEMLRLPHERIVGRHLRSYVLPDEAATLLALIGDAADGPVRGELTFTTADGERVPVYLSLNPLARGEGPALICGVLTDLTRQKLHLRELADANDLLLRAIAERERVEEALRQSQKMEAVGQLTGGIAHDFNNLLQGITGSLDMVQRRIAQGRTGELERLISGAMASAARAAALTHRLLAFSRRQPLDPKPVRANPLVAGMEELLRRTMGEAIRLDLVLADELWPTLCDPNQLESAMLNLVINARDAMPDGGILTVETTNAALGGPGWAAGGVVVPGQYVCICVSDTGVGMSPEVIERAFDPFFTTKPIGQGTGLGLSMIYGFARQSEGYCRIESQIGRGTAVRLYLPRHRGEASADEAASQGVEAHAAKAGQIVLVVEDEPVVRGLVVEVLRDLGYGALEAADGPSGLEVLRSRERIDLLVTDVGLPGLNGRQMADAGRLHRPGLNILFMTGYAESASAATGFLEPGMELITKPFSLETLTARIQAIIDLRPR